MKERPILFSAPMVRAILEGRKTQTRRVMNPQPLLVSGGVPFRPLPPRLVGVADPKAGVLYRSRYGVRGDRLWVRETWGLLFDNDPDEQPTFWRADYTAEDERTCALPSKWRPSIHMPRARSRITLEVTGVRVERLQDIGYEDACAEGCAIPSLEVPAFETKTQPAASVESWDQTSRRLRWPQRSYEQLWASINGDDSWVANPWVWVIEFKRVTA